MNPIEFFINEVYKPLHGIEDMDLTAKSEHLKALEDESDSYEVEE